MSQVADRPTLPALDISEVMPTAIVPFDFGELTEPDNDIIEGVWHEVGPAPVTMGAQLDAEWRAHGMFGPVSEQTKTALSRGFKRPAPMTARRPAPSLDILGAFDNLFDMLSNLFDSVLAWTDGLASIGNAPRPARYVPAQKVLMVAPLALGGVIHAYLDRQNVPVQYELTETRPAYVPEYVFSVSAGHLKWTLKTLYDGGYTAQHDNDRGLYVIRQGGTHDW